LLKAKSLALGHVPIIDPHPRNVPGGKEAIATEARGRRKAGYALAEDVRYNERSAAERVNGSLKDDFGGRFCECRYSGEEFRAGEPRPDIHGSGAGRTPLVGQTDNLLVDRQHRFQGRSYQAEIRS
jgi:hypothetical protein